MSHARMGKKWADVDEDDDEEQTNQTPGKSGTSFETAPDKDGFKVVIEYNERHGQTYKVTKKVKVTTVIKRTNENIQNRKTMKKFGLAAQNDVKSEQMLIVRSEEAVNIEIAKKTGQQLATKDDVEDKFYEESLNITESLFKERKVWTANRPAEPEPAAVDDKKPSDAPADAPAGKGEEKKTAYLPPSLRNKGTGKGDEKGQQQQQEASLRITNLSDDVKEGDLQDLFSQCGRLARVYLAKDMTTYQSKGFAFITYHNREDGQRAIDKLNGHGYDNLILQVQWAKPRQ